MVTEDGCYRILTDGHLGVRIFKSSAGAILVVNDFGDSIICPTVFDHYEFVKVATLQGDPLEF